MIRYPLDLAQLRADIERVDPKWFTKAKARTKKLIALGRFEEKSSIWSDAKPAFMILQFNKCAFCERLFTGPQESRIEMDLEHFRPKGAVSVWEQPSEATAYPANTGSASDHGYFWLANDISNYLAACKICNSEYKRSYFPIAGPRCDHPNDPAAISAEKAYLLYPVGTADSDPEELITFTGTVARPLAPSGEKHARAALIIDFFGLNERDQLHIQRAEMIERFGNALVAVADGRATPADQTYVARIGDPLIPHAACLRAFKLLWDRDQAGARNIFDACRDMLAKRLADPSSKGLGVGYS